ncbi:O-antigen polysaccharide polymerase Wzy [Halobacillus kuroshimensis]|uniref:O-antigen polysaccharide polymerase Wzy n=1 Tax=Halobacillus kuroshimensis TaxID=302481 RepID=A0ABS3DUY2_9BACI|nr:O-antigen polysaccharide polymerase Wzy [Halobacillus kuroshimensis]MBN8235142.1 O-antigen polysaccharide polymerase Wzy [Halobacillus kuroshimensis]
MVDLINFLTLIWVSIWFVRACYDIIKGKNNTILFAIIVFYVFFAIPIALDFLYGKPFYKYYPGFELSKKDNLTTIIYCFYISFIPLLWWITGKKRKKDGKSKKQLNFREVILYKPLRILLILMMTSPLIFWVFSPEPFFYSNYAAILTNDFVSKEVHSYHTLISLVTILSVMSGCALLLIKDKISTIDLITIFPWLFISVWLNGKRAIVIIVFLLIGYALWSKGILKSWRFLISVLLAVLLVTLYSSMYQENVRYKNTSISSEQEYTNFRVDYGRDDVTKMTIYSELYDDGMKILDYRGQSTLYNFFMFIPRDWWQAKPWPYAVYFTSEMLYMEPSFIGWGMTTSWLEEAIANFSWFGMLIGPLLISFMCRLGDSMNNPLISALTVLVISLLLVVQLAAFAPLMILWILLILWSKTLNITTKPTLSNKKIYN